MTAQKRIGIALLSLVALAIAGLIGYSAGSDTGLVRCKPGAVLTLRVSGADDHGNGSYGFDIGNCSRLDDDAFKTAVDGLVSRHAAATTTTTTKSTTVPAQPTAAELQTTR